ncbi:MAG: sigma-70 family RNA polymerase sigma factor [Akkermansiaceae bacterium]|jgi:RNA polymerase sigma-70 factor (ECF subfamily)|tara:strand:+ start:13306 stop:13851 length:546 start_codon:yes stop_codon:yes gene_type:complete
MAFQTDENQSRYEEFVSLYVRNEAAVFSFVMALVKHTADAEDVVQRASMTMWRCFDRFESGTNFRAWAFQIAKNEALNLLSKNKRDRHVFSEKLIAMLADQAEERADDLDARQRALDFCVEKLPPEEHEIVKGCYREGATIRSFSEQAGVTSNKIYKQLNRLRRKLQRCVERQLGREEMTQ